MVFLQCLNPLKLQFLTGLHTPGCQAALVAVAPAFSGAITGLTFFFVAISGMINPAMTKWIVRTGSAPEWNIVFYISTVIALIPVIVFSWWELLFFPKSNCHIFMYRWGSADVQSWACGPSSSSVSSCPTLATIEGISNATISTIVQQNKDTVTDYQHQGSFEQKQDGENGEVNVAIDIDKHPGQQRQHPS